jgi:hypothetical protein
MTFFTVVPHKRRAKSRVAVFTGAAAFALATFAPPPGGGEAQACGRGGNYGLEGLAYAAAIVAATLVVVDVGFASYDIVKAAKHERGSDGMAVAELLVMVPQSLLFLSVAASEKHDPGMFVVIGLIPTAMAIHGAATLAAPRHDDPAPAGATAGALSGPRSIPSFGLSGAF